MNLSRKFRSYGPGKNGWMHGCKHRQTCITLHVPSPFYEWWGHNKFLYMDFYERQSICKLAHQVYSTAIDNSSHLNLERHECAIISLAINLHLMDGINNELSGSQQTLTAEQPPWILNKHPKSLQLALLSYIWKKKGSKIQRNLVIATAFVPKDSAVKRNLPL